MRFSKFRLGYAPVVVGHAIGQKLLSTINKILMVKLLSYQ
jgi:hypothetical protein